MYVCIYIYIYIYIYIHCLQQVALYFKRMPNPKDLRRPVKTEACNIINKETPGQLFFFEFCKIFKNTFSVEHLRVTASALRSIITRFNMVLNFRPVTNLF